ncbi:MAG: DUF3099 domain-containing protein [Micromonosporaceae bacterium]|nr:DUF3099 domain-containing protein [Micromonosporaceae bacterium]
MGRVTRRFRSGQLRGTDPVLITDAPEDPEKELRRREVRYVAMMLTRAACLVGAAVIVAQQPWLWQVWALLCVVGAVLLPWLAVLIANDRPPKKRRAASPPGAVAAQPALERREYKIIDADE